MKKPISIGLIALAGIALAGCSDETSGLTDGRGKVNLNLDLDVSVTQASGRGRADGDVSADDLKLKMTSADGSYAKEWASVAEFAAETSFRVGDYTLEAYYGDETSEGFEVPYYTGSTDVKVTDGGTTTVSLTAALANSMVTVEYTEAFRNYFTAYSAKLHSAGGTYVDYPAGETRAAYVRPGECDLTISITKPNGTEATLQPASFTAKAKTHHKVKFDVNNGEVGDAVLSISFDETVLEGETVEIELSDELMNAPAPVATPKGFTAGQTLSLIEGSKPAAPLSANLIARGGLQSVTLTTQSRSLTAQGWPEEVDLMAATDAQRSAMTALGFSQRGLWGKPDKMAVVDFTDVISHIAYLESGANSTVFTLQIKDKYGKVLEEPLSFTVDVDRLALELSNASQAKLGDTAIQVDLKYNGGDIDAVTLKYKKDAGTYAATTFNVLSHEGDTYRIEVAVPAVAHNVELRAECGSLTSDITVEAFPFDLTYSDNNVFATHALVSIVGINEPSADVAARATLYVSTDGTNFTPATATRNGADFTLTGLEAGTKYYLRATVDGKSGESKTITTEAATQLPESGFDSWSTEKLGDYQYMWRVNGSAWGTMNDLTLSSKGSGSGNGLNTGGCAYKATAGTIPANGRSTKSMDSGGTFGTNKSGDGHTVGNASLHSDRSHSGANAALIRTVGWGSGNSASSRTSGQHFGTCDNVTPGELYLGSYSNGNPSYGRTFASRPSSLSFYYRYETVTAGNGDYGTAEITVYDASGNVIASASRNLTEQGSYALVTMPLSYSAGVGKAARISVIFKSSGNSAALAKDTKYFHCPGVKNVSGGEYVGSELYVDDITLNY